MHGSPLNWECIDGEAEDQGQHDSPVSIRRQQCSAGSGMTDLTAKGAAPQFGSADVFSEVDATLDRGDVESARQLTQALLQDRALDPTPRLTARVVLRLAYCDLAQSRVRQAHAGSSQAALVLRESATVSDEVDALALWACTASILGRSVEAVETALLATRLADDLPAGLSIARAFASLGMAYGWGRSFQLAEEAFDTAIQVVDRYGDAGARLELTAARSWVQAIYCFSEGRTPERSAAPASLKLFGQSQAEIAKALTPGSAATLATSGSLVYGLLSLWSGRDDEAKRALARCGEAGVTSVGWMLSAQSWLAAEIALRAGDLDAASMHAARMATLASEVDHLPLQCIGYELSAEVFARQGNYDLALNEHRLLLNCERITRVQDLQGRADIAALRVESRRGRAQIKELSEKTMRFEKWAHEDALTGIANLRRFNQCLSEWSSEGERVGNSLSVALIDVDRFRDINNNFSYEVGNQALRGIAEEMVAYVRETDLAARWGGDEFAILFRDTDRQTAQQVASRIQDAVRQRDWASVAQGLSVSVSVGVTEARAGDTKASIIARSEDLMYAQKVARRRAELVRTIDPLVLRTVVEWLRSAERVVIFVGHGSATPNNPASYAGEVTVQSPEDWRTFGDVRGLGSDPNGFADFWHKWRQGMRGRQPTLAHKALAELAHRIPQVTFITERVDGVLAMAGAENVIELYGNAFRHRCGACGRVNPARDKDRCIPCGATASSLRPDVVLLGEHVDGGLLSDAEWAMKRASLIFVVDCNVSIYPGSALVQKGHARGARVVALGSSSHERNGVVDISLAAAPEVVAGALSQALDEPPTSTPSDSELSEDGFAVLCFLTGHRADNSGIALDVAIRWKDWEITTHQATIPWMFPLPTRSSMNPHAPMPSRRDFEILAANDQVRSGMKKAFGLMLRFYGFDWQDGQVSKAEGWRTGFAQWAVTFSHHDLFISRILGALRLMGLQEESQQFLRALEVEVRQYRGYDSNQPLWHWRLAVNGGPEDDQKVA